MHYRQLGNTGIKVSEKGIGVLVRVPMAQGILTGKFRPAEAVAADHRRPGDKMTERIAQAEQFRALAESWSMPLGQLALRYAMNSEAISAVIPGARTTEQVTQNVAASTGQRSDAELLAAIADIQRKL